MKSKDVVLGMRVVPHTKTMGRHSLSHVLERMEESHADFMYISGWDKESKCWFLRIPHTLGSGFCFTAKEFEPYKGNENEV